RRGTQKPHAGRSAPPTLGEKRSFLHAAEVVAPRVDDIERALAPWALRHLATGLAVHLVWRERLEAACAGVHRLEVANREVERLRAGRRRQPAGRRIENREDHASTVKVVA